MAILTYPSLIPSKVSWSLKANTEKFTSPLNGSIQTFGRPGSRWKANLDYDLLTMDQGDELESFINSLEGMQGRFYLHPHHHRQPRNRDSASSYDSIVITSVTDSKNIQVTGFGAGIIRRVMGKGDFFECFGELKQLTVNVDCDSSGGATLTFTPPFRNLPDVGFPVNVIDPKCQMMLTNDENPVSVQGVTYQNVVISCLEVF